MIRFDWDSAARELGFPNEREMWEELYGKRELPISRLSEIFKVGTTTLVRRLGRIGVEKRPKGGANNIGGGHKLLLIDPRVLFSVDESLTARLVGVHATTVYKVKKQLTWREK